MYISPLAVPMLLLGPGDTDFPALGLRAYQKVSNWFSKVGKLLEGSYCTDRWNFNMLNAFLGLNLGIYLRSGGGCSKN
jgi:hypothetical protein